MLGDIFHIENTAFRMLPNPTVFPWDRKSFSIRHLLYHYTSALREDNNGQINTTTPRLSPTLLAVAETAERVEERFNQDDQRPHTPQKEAGYSRETVAVLHGALAECTRHLQPEEDAPPLPLVEPVFRAHLEVVLGFLNDAGGENDIDGAAVAGAPGPRTPGGRRESTARMPTAAGGTSVMPPTLADLDSASPDERCTMLADLYVGSVRTKVVNRVGAQLPETERGAVNDVWCLLVFRMLFWLLLHDFHRNDVQLPKSDIFGSRVPVYIS